jgi:hypothetical protein
VKYEASAPIASQPFGQPKPRLLDRLLTPAPRVPEIDCKISQPNSAGLEAPRARQTDRNQPLTTRTEIQGQGNRLQPLQRLQYGIYKGELTEDWRLAEHHQPLKKIPPLE